MKYYLAIFFLLVTNIINAQDKSETGQYFLFSPGISYQNQFFGEVNVMYAYGLYADAPPHTIGPRLGFEFNFDPNNFIIAPKIGYEVSVALALIRLNVIKYFTKNDNEFRLLPEIGLCWRSYVNLTYGYSIALPKSTIKEISISRITLTFNLNKHLLKD
jgi:hypothetical protein